MQDVVEAAVLTGTLDSQQVGGFLDHTDQRLFALHVGTDAAPFGIGDIKADLALPQTAFGV